jgi:hypothetical protein
VIAHGTQIPARCRFAGARIDYVGTHGRFGLPKSWILP